jgi:cysteinyl-tRNA synthetase
MDEDLNVAAAWGGVFDWVRETNGLLASGRMSAGHAAAGLAAWQQIDKVFALGRKGVAQAPADIQALLEQREAARKSKDFKRSDQLRDQLKTKGWLIEDTPKGPRLKPL